MKKYIVIILIAFVSIGCSPPQKEKPIPNPAVESNEEENKENNEDKEQTSASFRSIDVRVESGVIHLTGQAKVTDDEFYYMIEYGDDPIVEETNVTLDEIDDDGWGPFIIKTPIKNIEEREDEELIAILYAKNKDGKKVNPNYIPIDLVLPY
ncbi:MAG TPA: hypothetical protein VF095_03475 [Bacillota bacterium]